MKSDSRLLWVTDADNTLWDTDAVYREAQLALLADVELAVGVELASSNRLAFLREIDQSIAQAHHSGLKYPGELLARGLALRLCGKPLKEAARIALHGALVKTEFDISTPSERFAANLRKSPRLRSGVRVAFDELLQVRARIIVATEGSKSRIDRLLGEHGLAAQVHTCIEAPKTKEMFLRLAKHSEHRRPWMIGDQLDRDILPSKAAGYSTVYFPGGFNPHWQKAEYESEANATVTSYEAGVNVAVHACLSSQDNVA